MTTEEWLDGYPYQLKLISVLEKKKDELLGDATRTTKYITDEPRGKTYESANEKYLSKVEEVSEQIRIAKKTVTDIENAIYSVENPKYRILLIMKYMFGESWENISETLGMSDKTVRERISFKAIKAVEKIIKEREIK